MSNLRYTKEHEWVRVEGDVATCGITDYAQSQLGDVVYVELPEVGRVVEREKECAVVESVKAASDIYAPLSGVIVEANDRLATEPGLVNADAAGEGWFFKLKLADTGELDGLMSEDDYKAYVEGMA